MRVPIMANVYYKYFANNYMYEYRLGIICEVQESLKKKQSSPNAFTDNPSKNEIIDDF